MNAFEWGLMVAIVLLAVVSFVVKGQFSANNCIACVSAVIGVSGVVMSSKGSMANWIIGVIHCFLTIYICFSSHVYGDALQRLLYTLPMQFIGWSMWSKRERKDNSTQIKTRYMGWLRRGKYLIITALIVLCFGWFLKFVGPHISEFFDVIKWKAFKQDYDYEWLLWVDSTTTVLSFVAMFIAVKAYVEQWYIWLIINVFSIMLWLNQSTDFSFMEVSKYSVYLLNSLYGIYNWHRLSKV